MPTIAKTEKLTEGRVRSLWLWETDVPYIIRDERTPELHLRKGKKRTSFYFYHEQRVRGERLTASKLLGHMPQMTLAEARKEAKKHAGRIASDRHETGKRAATKFADALEDHIAYLERHAEENGKPAMWAGVVRRLGKQLLLPKWGRWSLVEMSKGRRAVKVWHRSVSNDHGPIIANRCVEITRRLSKGCKGGRPATATAERCRRFQQGKTVADRAGFQEFSEMGRGVAQASVAGPSVLCACWVAHGCASRRA